MMLSPLQKMLQQRRAPEIFGNYLQEIKRYCATPALQGKIWQIMEVCGTHTQAIYRYGIKRLLPENLRLISGPGCPVCVTPARELAEALAMARLPGVTLMSFGDMLRVPVAGDSLLQARDAGADVRFVTSPLEALATARQEAGREVVFFGVGFETTAPLSAVTVQLAAEQGISNFSLLSVHRSMPQALRCLLNESEQIDALLCPGHVAAVTGANYFNFVAEELQRPGVIAGFEPVDILKAILDLVRQLALGEHCLLNDYPQVVQAEASPYAWKALHTVFEPVDAEWRGLGFIPQSGLDMRQNYAGYDARQRFDIPAIDLQEPAGCRCGAVLRGEIEPSACSLFAQACTPETPQGACMVSTEGSCAAAFRYERIADD